MKMYHESLIPKLCDSHLQNMWIDGWQLLEMIKDQANYVFNLSTLEFYQAPLSLAYRIHLVHDELLKRGFHPRKDINPFDVTDAPITQLVRELRYSTKRMSLDYEAKQLKEMCLHCHI